jgi:beta-lactamase regulating signal transducer with metallopeptidase domain
MTVSPSCGLLFANHSIKERENKLQHNKEEEKRRKSSLCVHTCLVGVVIIHPVIASISIGEVVEGILGSTVR